MMEETEKLANKLDEIDEKFRKDPKDRSDPSWNSYVTKKDHIVEQMYDLFPSVPETFRLSHYLLSTTTGYQTVAVIWTRFKKDLSHLNVLCYILLNSTSNFLTYHTLHALKDMTSQCDYHQLCQIKQTLLSYSPPDQTSRSHLKNMLSKFLKSQIDFSITDIEQNSYWWRDVESKFFNSLSGISQYRLDGLKIIRNQHLFEQFNSCRSQFGSNTQILYVYHGSSPKALRAIAETGFFEPDVLTSTSKPSKQLDPGYFGCGIYHGFAADYAIFYAETYKTSREILLSMVLPGRSYVVQKGGEKFGGKCEVGFDSHISPENKEIVLFQSAQVLPLFIIQFKRVPNAEIVEEQP